MIHPVYNRLSILTEHPEGELEYLGDALGRDCVVVKFVDGWIRLHDGDGSRNEDWFGWGAAVLAPFDSVVESVHHNPVANEPGHHSGGKAGSVIFLLDGGVHVLYVHVDGIEVKLGDAVVAGQRIAKVGNNGYSWYPHIHVGAWKDDTPLQIRFDLRALGRLQSEDPDRYYDSQSQPRVDP
jgi:murein DD-endopeptidase MepM/ murein hydrolase activator NlpD